MKPDSPLEKLCKQAEAEGKWLVRRHGYIGKDNWYTPVDARCWFRQVTGFRIADPEERPVELIVRLNQLENAKAILAANGIEVVE